MFFEPNGQTQTLLLETFPESASNTYVANSTSRASFMALLFVGKDVFSKSDVTIQAGGSLYYTNNINMSGVVNQFALPEFDNLNYQYSIRSTALLATAKVNYTKNDTFQPYLSVGLGGSQNQSRDYVETPRIVGAVPMSPYKNKSVDSFAYSVGVGFMLLNQSPFSLGIGYEFSDLGSSRLGVSPAQTTHETLKLSHIYLNQVLLNIRLTFPTRGVDAK